MTDWAFSVLSKHPDNIKWRTCLALTGHLVASFGLSGSSQYLYCFNLYRNIRSIKFSIELNSPRTFRSFIIHSVALAPNILIRERDQKILLVS